MTPYSCGSSPSITMISREAQGGFRVWGMAVFAFEPGLWEHYGFPAMSYQGFKHRNGLLQNGLRDDHTVNGRNPAQPKTPCNDGSPVNTPTNDGFAWFRSAAKWISPPSTLGEAAGRVRPLRFPGRVFPVARARASWRKRRPTSSRKAPARVVGARAESTR